ncbi:MAG: hypothetical protein N3A63_00010 [Bacteroidetes bacterium]|nr:hypothetical protein [Bacteroidota bacterium]
MESTKLRTLFTYLAVVHVCITGLLVSQVVYVPPTHEIYKFLKRMESKGYITSYRDAALPLSRKEIAYYLQSLEEQVQYLTNNEKDSYYFFTTEFKYELLLLEGDQEPSEIRWHALTTKLFEGQMNLDPNIWFQWRKEGNEITRIRTLGLKLYGYAYNTVGYYFNIVDNVETGDNLNPKRLYTDEKGIVVSTIPSPHEFHYDENDVQLTVQVGRVTASIEKISNVWGYGERGSVIFSQRPPTFPLVKLRFPLSKSIDFVYFHGELNSDVVDSTSSYLVVHPNYTTFRRVDHPKYIAAHQIEFSIVSGIDISLGESVIYSDKRPLLIYCIPIMFFKAAEHYNRDVDNTQLFGSIDVTLIKKFNIYSSVFIDEINTDEILDEFKSRKQVAYTLGVRSYDIPFQNVEMTIEYTRANPGVYNHKFTTATFSNSGFTLGHWIGQNADLFYASLSYTPVYNFRITPFYERFRKGEELPIADQYASDQGRKGFLFGKLHSESTAGIMVRYQPLREVFFNGQINWRSITDEQEPTRRRNKQLAIRFSIGIGVW